MGNDVEIRRTDACGSSLDGRQRENVTRTRVRKRNRQSSFQRSKRKSRKNLKKSVNKEIERVKHLVKEVHRKVALDLVRKFDCILIPRFSTKKMVRKPKGENEKPRRISKKTARAMLTWSHHQFRMLLSDKAIMTGKEVVTVTEEYTTQACGACGVLNKKIGKYHSLFFCSPFLIYLTTLLFDCCCLLVVFPGGNDIFKCPQPGCQFCIGRDENGARNIFLKYLQ